MDLNYRYYSYEDAKLVCASPTLQTNSLTHGNSSEVAEFRGKNADLATLLDQPRNCLGG